MPQPANKPRNPGLRRAGGIVAAAVLLVLLGAGCQESTGPRSMADAVFGKGNGGGSPPGAGGGNSLTVEFVSPVALVGPATADYTAAAGAVSGTNGRNSLQVNESPYTLTIDLADEIAAMREIGKCEDPVFDDVGLTTGPPITLVGELAINVDKRAIKRNGSSDGSVYTHTNGIVVNFTTVIDDVEYFLTTGSGDGAVNGMNVAEDTFARTGGFLRVNADSQIGPICEGIVDYEFTAR